MALRATGPRSVTRGPTPAARRRSALCLSSSKDSSPSHAHTFDSLGLPSFLASRARELGASEPSSVQSQALPTLNAGSSAALRSAPGTGKTLAYLLPALSSITSASKPSSSPTSLVVTPSRELASQVAGQARALLGPGSEPMVCLCSGGAGAQRQRERLKANCPFMVVGTPGRLAELSREGALGIHHISYLVIDEAESLLSPGDGLDDDVARLLSHAGRKAKRYQIVLAGAGLGDATVSQCEDWTGIQPEIIDGEGRARVPPTVSHVMQPVLVAWRKVDDLRRCINALDARSAIVFLNGSRKVKDIAGKLNSNSVPVATLHGLQKDQERKASIGSFKNGKARALVTTEVAAKGLDVPHCDAVFSFDVPLSAESYAHRAGRTGRFKRGGVFISLAERRRGEERILRKMASQLGVEVTSAIPKQGKLVPATGADGGSDDNDMRRRDHAKNRAPKKHNTASQSLNGSSSAGKKARGRKGNTNTMRNKREGKKRASKQPATGGKSK